MVNAQMLSQSQGEQLYYAAMIGNIEEMIIALFNGADINWNGPRNKTPLHVAAEYYKADAVQWLLSKGATVDSRDF
uniref:Uncharacterized protein n=1 Tax=Amphimedon queenslandica TaxID=400682 RepID=A0A1X7TAJ3_AMPQE